MSNLKNQISDYLIVEEHRILANEHLIIRLDSDDFKIDDDELLDISDDSSEELVGSIQIPGMLNIEAPKESFQLYFNFEINFVIPEVSSKDKNITTYEFEKGDIICFASTKSNNTDIKVVDKLFENRVKYLRGDLEKQTMAIYDQLKATANIKMHHIETILTTLYGEYEKDEFIPVRLTKNQKYTKDNALSTKDSAHKFNSAVGFNYGYTKDNIVNNISRKYVPTKTDLEKVIGGNFDDL